MTASGEGFLNAYLPTEDGSWVHDPQPKKGVAGHRAAAGRFYLRSSGDSRVPQGP